MFARLITLVAACVAVCSCASTSVMTEQSLVELPIIQVALQDDWMGLSNARPAKHLLRKTYPAWLMAPDGPGFWRRGAVSQEDLNITIPPDLLEKLPSANKRSVSLMSIRQSIYALAGSLDGKPTVVVVSRPVISSDGKQAVVALACFAPTGWCSTGYVAYLEYRHAGWAVVGYGCYWVT